MSQPQLLLPADYVRDAAARMRTAKRSINIIALTISRDDTTRELIDAACEAATRGVTVDIAADVFTYSDKDGSYRLNHLYTERARELKSLRKQLRSAGVKFHWLGDFGPFMFAGRTHTKWTIVDDTVYSFGGVNLYKPGIESNDYMIRMDDGLVANRLRQAHKHIVRQGGNRRQRSYKFGEPDRTVLLDGGLLGDSIIYRRACRLIKNSVKVTYVSQYCPTGRLSKLLHKTNSELYFNRPDQAKSVNRALIRWGMFLHHHETLYRHDQYLHAKFIIGEHADGSKVAITGSHNFVSGGGLLGTREVALETSDPHVIAELERYFIQHIQ